MCTPNGNTRMAAHASGARVVGRAIRSSGVHQRVAGGGVQPAEAGADRGGSEEGGVAGVVVGHDQAGEPGGKHRPAPQSLANGAAGIALLHVERARAHHGDWTTVHAWLSAAAGGDLSAGPNAGRYFGAPALALVTHPAAEHIGKYRRALANLHTATTALTRTRLDHAHARIDRGDRPALAEFALIRGLTGLGAYHLRCDPHQEVTTAVLAYLVRLTEPLPGRTDGLPGWWTDLAPTGRPTPDYPGGHGNFGMAHGIAGPLALLSLALRRGIVVDGHTDAITRICAWLDAWRQDHPAGPWWPRTITPDEVHAEHTRQPGPRQPSWCYGTPGLARAQQLAGLAIGDTERQGTAETAPLSHRDACLLLA